LAEGWTDRQMYRYTFTRANTHTHTHTHTNWQTGSQAERQTGSQTERQTDQADKHAGSQADLYRWKMDGQTTKETDGWHTHTYIFSQSDTDSIRQM
jgi:hypothetical protein